MDGVCSSYNMTVKYRIPLVAKLHVLATFNYLRKGKEEKLIGLERGRRYYDQF